MVPTTTSIRKYLFMGHCFINEIFAEACQMTKDEKYLSTAKKFSHTMLSCKSKIPGPHGKLNRCCLLYTPGKKRKPITIKYKENRN
jgi:hypothetical protein